MDERLLPVADELSKVPAIPVSAGTVGTIHIGEEVMPSSTPNAALIRRPDATTTLELTLDGRDEEAGTDEVTELIVRGPHSQVLQIQRVVQALTLNDKTLNQKAKGLEKNGG